MHGRWIAIVAAVGLLTVPALAGATSQLAATNVRIGDHPAFVRVVADFNGTISAREVEAGYVTKTMATVRLDHPGVTTWTSGRSGYGVSAAVQPATQGINIAMTFAPLKFKYLSYAVVTGNRLAMDLWKSVPPAAPTQTCSGLTLQSTRITPGRVVVKGTAHGIFENQFQVVVRKANGRVIARKHVMGSGSWSTTMSYTLVRRQLGTVEAVAFSAKDGALECLAQKRVTLPAS